MPSAFSKPTKAADGGDFKFKVPDTLPQGRGRIPAGKYPGRCTDIVSAPAKSSGNPMWTWTFIITKGANAGRDFKLYTVLTDDAAWKIIETLKAMGHEIEAGDEINISKKDVIGVGCTMHIKDDAGRDGDGEWSKLDKISAHPQGAGYRPGKGIAAAAVEEEPDDDGEEAGEGEEGETFACSECDAIFDSKEEAQQHMEEEHPEPEPPPRRTVAKRAAPMPVPTPAKRGGKAPATLGRGKKR